MPTDAETLTRGTAARSAPEPSGANRAVMISCRHLWKLYGPASPISLDSPDIDATIERARAVGQIPAVCDVSFDVREGEIFVIMGLSGSGKSTVVRCLSRLVEPTAGTITIAGRDLLALKERELIELRRHKMGMVFQNFGLLPHLNVLDNVAYPLRVQGLPLKERYRRAEEVIALVGLAGREYSFPRELSGGQQQRVGIARSLAVKPDIWLLDEPFSALDPLIRRQMQDEFLRLQGLLRKSIVFITHDFLEALRVADRMAIMREGRIVQTGRPAELVLDPADLYVANFTREVPLVKVLTAGAIATPVDGSLDPAQAVPASAVLEEVLPSLARCTGPVAVRSDDGSVVGQVSAADIVRALARAAPGGP